MNGRALVALALGLAVAGCGGGTKTVTQTTTVVHTTDAHALYRKFGFTDPSAKVLERGG